MEYLVKSRNSSSNSPVCSMEPIPTATEQPKVGKKRGSSSMNHDTEGDQSSEQQVHIWTERERRKRMRSMFTNLQAFLPQLPSKADKSSIVDEVITYIKTLEQTLQTLEKKKLAKMQGGGVLDSEPSSAVSAITTSEPVTREAFLAAQGPSKLSTTSTNAPLMASAPSNEFQTWFSPNVVLNMCGDDAHICVCSVKKQGLFPNLLHILQKHNLDVVSAHVSSHHRHSCTYMIHVHAGVGCGSQFPESLSVEDTFKLAAGEMNLWLLSC